MATLKQAIQFAQKNPQDPKSIELAKRLARGDFNTQAKSEGINLSPIQQTPEKQGFFKGEFTGGADISELTGIKKFGAELFQSTLGSKGLLGVAQQPGKAIGALSAIKEKTRLEEERAEIFDQARQLLQIMRNTTDPAKLEGLRKLAQGVDESLAFITEAQKGLERFTPTVKESIGTTLSAAATVAPIGRIGREVVRGTTFAAGGALAEDRLPTVGELGIGATIGAAVPIVGKTVSAVTKKVFSLVANISKRLAAGLGVSVEEIVSNPKVAQQTVDKLLSGKATTQSILRKNAEDLLSDVRTFRQGLRSNYGKALESLSKVEILLEDVKTAAIQALKNNGIQVTKKGVNMEGAEFTNKLIQKRALGIINELNNLKSLDGKTLKIIMNKINALRFKTPGSDPERLAFNVLMGDLEKALGGAVSKSTPKLQAANKAFTEGMQIVEVMEQEFGKVKFANLKELNAFAKKLEDLLKKKGIAPEVIDDFLIKLGKDPTALRATEAVRGAFATQPTAEAAGITPFEFFRQVTAGVLDPKDITRLTIQIARISNLSEKTVKPMLEQLAKLQPIERVAFIRSLILLFGGQGETGQQ